MRSMAAFYIFLLIFSIFSEPVWPQAVPGPSIANPVSTSVLSGYKGNFLPAVTATIASSGTTSTAVALKGFQLSGVLLPATFTGTSITFLASVDGVTYVLLKVTAAGTTLSYVVTQNTFAAIDPKDFAGVNYVKIVSGSTEGSARTLKLALRGL